MKNAINLLMEKWIKGVDTYTHNGSTWLIFTDSKKWVIELTDSKTLWYNYNFFKQIFDFTSLDVVENQSYITKWVEDNIINGVNHTGAPDWNRDKVAKYAIENGVKNTKQSHIDNRIQERVEGTIENGVKKTNYKSLVTRGNIEDIIDGGVKETISTLRRTLLGVDDIIQNGIKETRLEMNITEGEVDDIIQDGVKHTFGDKWHKHNFVEDIIQNGVRDTQSNPYENTSWIEGVIKKGVKLTGRIHKDYTEVVEYLIENGVRKTYHDTDNYTDDVKEVIREGVKETKEMLDWVCTDRMLSNVLENGVRTSHPRAYVDEKMIDKVIDKGVIETHDDVYHHKGRIDGVIKNGVKETKTPGKYGDIMSTVEWMKENNSTSYPKMIDDVVDNGEKVNGTYAGGQRQSEKCKSVVEYGTKNPTD
jgi:hypothetical protein